MNHHPALDQAAKDLLVAVKGLTQQLEEMANESGAVTILLDSINKARTSVRILPTLDIQSLFTFPYLNYVWLLDEFFFHLVFDLLNNFILQKLLEKDFGITI